MTASFRLLPLALVVALLGGCAAVPTAIHPTAPPPAPAPEITAAATAYVLPGAGIPEGFAFSEKPGDAGLGAALPTQGSVLVSGFLGSARGSTWAGVGVIVPGAPQGAPQDLSGYRAVRLTLSATTAKVLRLRWVGPDKAVQQSGCYPSYAQPVSTDPREVEVPLAAFAPEAYCETKGKTVSETSRAAVAFEVVDAAVDSGVKRRDTQFQVGAISLVR